MLRLDEIFMTVRKISFKLNDLLILLALCNLGEGKRINEKVAKYQELV